MLAHRNLFIFALIFVIAILGLWRLSFTTDIDGLPGDLYLKVTQKGGQLLRGEVPK